MAGVITDGKGVVEATGESIKLGRVGHCGSGVVSACVGDCASAVGFHCEAFKR